MGGIGSDPLVHRQYLLEMISYYEQMKQSLLESIELKAKVNDNPGKILVLKRLLGISSDRTPSTKRTESSPSMKSPLLKVDILGSPKPPMDVSGSPGNQHSESELEALIEAAQAENSRLINSLSAIQSRNKTLSSELTKTSDILNVARSQDIDSKLTDYTKEIEDVNLEIAMIEAA